jgi:hypothetical protein
MISEAKLRAAHEALLHTPGLQLRFSAPPQPKPPPAWLEPLIKALVALAPVWRIIFWAGVVVGVVLILWVIVRDLPIGQRWRRKRPRAPAAEWRPEAGAAQALLAEADRLAAEGAYAEAVHLILFRSIEDIAVKRPGAVRPALTSRDLVEAAPLSEAGRRAFRTIAEAVERSFFGGRRTEQDEFERCRREYEAFALAEAAR